MRGAAQSSQLGVTVASKRSPAGTVDFPALARGCARKGSPAAVAIMSTSSSSSSSGSTGAARWPQLPTPVSVGFPAAPSTVSGSSASAPAELLSQLRSSVAAPAQESAVSGGGEEVRRSLSPSPPFGQPAACGDAAEQNNLVETSQFDISQSMADNWCCTQVSDHGWRLCTVSFALPRTRQ